MSDNNLIRENFFIIDSNNLKFIVPHMFGFTVSKKGILTDNYYKKYGYNEEPEPIGAYVMIKKIGNEIRLYQDFLGSYGIFIYENKNKDYFAVSNSFLFLQEFLIGKHNISINKDFSDNLLISDLCTPSIHETLIKEIIRIPSNSIIIINTENKILKVLFVDYQENSIPFESEEGLKIIDSWVDKWAYIIRSLKNKTNNIYSDLSGGFDSRLMLSILISSGIDLNEILINSSKDNKHGHEEDFAIASNISLKLGFKLNNLTLNQNHIRWDLNNTLYCTKYSKLGFHKEFYLKDRFYKVPRFGFSGCGGEIIRGAPGCPIDEYIKSISSKGRKIKGHEEEFFNSSMRICNRSIKILKNRKTFDNDYEISSFLYSKGRARHHFGTLAVESFIPNVYILQPLIDPDLKKIKYDISGNLSHDLIAYIYVRFGHNLIDFPIQGKRYINLESIKKAKIFNNKLNSYKIKSDYNANFFIDDLRVSPIPNSNEKKNVNEYLRDLFKSSKFIEIINKIYDNNVYNWAKEYYQKSNYFPLRHGYGLYSISVIYEKLLKKKRIINNNTK